MAKITRKHQKIFAYNAGVSTNVVATFGSLKAGSPAYSQDPDVLQALSAWAGGWGDAVVTNSAPAIQDFNSLFYVLTRSQAYQYQAGIPEYSTATEYHIGSLVSDGAGSLYLSVANTNTNNALDDATKWTLYKSIGYAYVTSSYTVQEHDYLIIANWQMVDANRTITLPTPTAAMAGREVIIKCTGSTFSYDLGITAGTNKIDGDVTTTYLSIKRAKRFMCDGTNWNIVGYFPF